MKDLKLILAVLLVLGGTYAFAQACLVPAPLTPPHAKQLIVNLLGDGGTTGCTAVGICDGCRPATVVPIGNAKCAVAVAIAEQSVANDNGWNDGGSP